MGFAKAFYDRLPAALQETALSLRGWQLRKRRFGSLYRGFRELLRWTERGDRGRVLEVQGRFLGALLARATAEVPHYRGFAGKALGEFPILRKETVRERKEDLLSRAFSPSDLLHGHTSGTTGSSLTLVWDRNVDVATNAVLWRHREWAGCPFGTRYASLLGRVVVPLARKRPPFWRENRAWNQMLLSSFHMNEENLDAYAGAIASERVEFLEAYPSTAYVLARHLEARGRTLPLRAVFTSAEPLLETQRESIERAFRCRVFDYLGSAERAIFAGECPEHRGLHLFDEYGVTEVLDDAGNAAPPGAPGRLVVTGLHNFAMPLIRYDLGDVSGIATEPCPCGRPLPLLLPITTKAEDLVVLPDGRFISASVLTHPFKPMTLVKESQIVQERPDLVRVLLVPRPGYDARDESRLLSALRERLGAGVSVRIEQVREIARGPRGKFRWVISRVPLRFGARSTANLYGGNAGASGPPSPDRDRGPTG